MVLFRRGAINVDLRLRDVPLLNRRPDVVVSDASLPDEMVLRPEHCDRQPGEYAAAGIRHFWRVENTDDPAKIKLFRDLLDPTTGTYTAAGVHNGPFTVTDPFTVHIDLMGLL